MAMHRTAWRPVSVRLPPETAKKRPFAREISHFLPGILTTIIITSNVFCVYDNSVMPEELMTGSNNKTRDITSNRKYLIKNARGQAAYKARMREAGYKQIAVWVREDVREAGRQAGLESDALLSGCAA
jgi:hypothetical protein